MEKDIEDRKMMNRRNFLALVGGTTSGVVCGYFGHAIGKSLEGFFGSAEELNRDFRVTRKFTEGDNSYLEEVLGDISEGGIGAEYFNNLREKDNLYKHTGDDLEAMHRQALKAPGVNSAPVRGLRDGKKILFEITKSLWSKESKETAHIQAQPAYTGNYNDLARLRMSAMERTSAIEESMRETGYKILANRNNTHREDTKGMSQLAELVHEHSIYISLLREFKNLTPRQVLEGENNESYKAAIQHAADHGIHAYVPNGFLTKNVALGTTIIGGSLGFIVGSKLCGGVSNALDGAQTIVKGSAKRARAIGRGINQRITRKGGRNK